MLYYTKTVRQTLDELQSSELGLAISEAEERLRLNGLNSIRVSSEPLWRKIIEPFANLSMIILIVAAAISIFRHTILDAIIITTIVLVSAVIYYVQRFSTERILRSLRKHEEQKVDVLRDEKNITISSTLLVPGDIMTLREGEKVPADARIMTARSLRVDEAQLTGESVPVDKQTAEISGEKEVYEQTNMLFQGSFVVSGEALAIVVATGNETEFGRLAQLTKDIPADSPVQQKIDKAISQIIAAIAGIAIVVFLLSLYRGTTIADSLQFVLALSVSAVPEDLPIAVSIILVLGMRRMARKKALVRTMRSIESIGVITTIATDKTGTLTKNQLTVQDTWHYQNSHSRLSHTMARAANQSTHNHGDPLDNAFLQCAETKNIQPSHHQPLLSLPFDQEFSMSGNLWHNGAEYDLAVKGAPEHVLLRCDLTENEHEQATAQLHKFTGNGYRVIAVAHTTLKKPITEFSELHKKDKLTFDGFVAVADVLRPEARSAIQTALQAGVSVRMITGDHFETAYHIARELGMVYSRDQVFDARHMNVMSDEQLEKIIDTIRVFSRVTPDHKYRILALLKKHNITAMTGDGVNDVPALTNAHVGVAMGSGAQIAKDAGDIILINDNFKGIVDAMREGRIIIANIRRMLVYLLATNTGEVLTTIAALVVGLPIPLVPVQILWVNLVTDTAMVIPLGLEPGERSTMRRRPGKPDAPLLDKFLISRIILIAVTMAALTLSLYAFYTHWHGAAYGRTIAFTALVVMQWASAIGLRSDDEPLFARLRVFNGKFYTGLAIAASLQLLAIFTPFGVVLHISPVALSDLAITGLAALIIPITAIEIHKYIGRRFLGRSQTIKNRQHSELAKANPL
jgi:calcium-translocating P-type ATPase